MEISTTSLPRQRESRSLATGLHKDVLQHASADSSVRLETLPPKQSLDIAEFQAKDNIDWDWVQLRMSGSVAIEDADSLIRKVDTIASTYVAAKNHLEQTYKEQEDKLAETMKKLDTLFTQAKQRISGSYEKTVGNFYESLGNSGIKKTMGESLSSAIDRRVQEMDQNVKESGILERAKGSSFRLIEFSLDARSLNEHESGRYSGSVMETDGEAYSLNDLQSAGMVAKAALIPDSARLSFMNDEELGIHFALLYMKASETMKFGGTSKEMTDFLLKSFSSYVNRSLNGSPAAQNAYCDTLKHYESEHNMHRALEKTATQYPESRIHALSSYA